MKYLFHGMVVESENEQDSTIFEPYKEKVSDESDIPADEDISDSDDKKPAKATPKKNVKKSTKKA